MVTSVCDMWVKSSMSKRQSESTNIKSSEYYWFYELLHIWATAIDAWQGQAANISTSLLDQNQFWFLSDPSPIIGYACHSPTPWRLVNLIDATLACKDANSKLVKVVNVADVDNEDRVGISLLQIWSWGLDIKLNFCSDFEHKVWSRFWSWLLMFGWGYEVESWSRFLS